MPVLAGPALAQSQTWTSPAVTDLQVVQVSTTVLEIQRELNQLGYNAGAVEGRAPIRPAPDHP